MPGQLAAFAPALVADVEQIALAVLGCLNRPLEAGFQLRRGGHNLGFDAVGLCDQGEIDVRVAEVVQQVFPLLRLLPTSAL